MRSYAIMILVRLPIPRCSLLIWVAAATMAGARAQSPQRLEGRTIASIQFEPRQQPLDGEELRSILPLKIRAPLRMEDVRETITRLWATLAYTDIQIDAEPAGEQVLI